MGCGSGSFESVIEIREERRDLDVFLFIFNPESTSCTEGICEVDLIFSYCASSDLCFCFNESFKFEVNSSVSMLLFKSEMILFTFSMSFKVFWLLIISLFCL